MSMLILAMCECVLTVFLHLTKCWKFMCASKPSVFVSRISSTTINYYTWIEFQNWYLNKLKKKIEYNSISGFAFHSSPFPFRTFFFVYVYLLHVHTTTASIHNIYLGRNMWLTLLVLHFDDTINLKKVTRASFKFMFATVKGRIPCARNECGVFCKLLFKRLISPLFLLLINVAKIGYI